MRFAFRLAGPCPSATIALIAAFLLLARAALAATEEPVAVSPAKAAECFRTGLGKYREVSAKQGAELLKKAHELDPDNALYAIYLADALYVTGKRGESNELAGKISKKLSEPHMVHFYKGMRALLRDDAEEAAYELRESLNQKVTPYALYELAALEIKQGEINHATEDLAFGTQRFPDDYYLNNLRGTLWFQGGDYDEAIASFNAAIEANTSLPFARVNRALARYELGSYDRALKDLDHVLDAYPGLAEARYLKALTLERLKQYGAARRIIEDLAKADPNDPSLWLAQGWLDYKTDKRREGEKLLLKYVQEKPDDPEGQYKLATLYAGRRKKSEAFAKLRRALELDYGRTSAWLARDAEWDRYRDSKSFQSLLDETRPN